MTRQTQDTVKIAYDELVRETAGAKLYKIEGHEVWLPRSAVIEDDTDDHEVELPEWLAHDRNLI